MANETYHPRGELVDGYKPREHPIYVIWSGIKSRCNNPKEVGYVYYGARGIGYCERWKHFANFAEDMFPTYEQGLSIERLDNNKDYGPDNCVWATRTEQCLNRRNFKNNSSPYPGVNRKKNGSYQARYAEEYERFNLGNFDTAEEARDYRAKFIELLREDPEAAMAMTERRARRDGSTGVRGITKHGDKYMVRRTKNGERIYIGSSLNFDEACKILERWLSEQG